MSLVARAKAYLTGKYGDDFTFLFGSRGRRRRPARLSFARAGFSRPVVVTAEFLCAGDVLFSDNYLAVRFAPDVVELLNLVFGRYFSDFRVLYRPSVDGETLYGDTTFREFRYVHIVPVRAFVVLRDAPGVDVSRVVGAIWDLAGGLRSFDVSVAVLGDDAFDACFDALVGEDVLRLGFRYLVDGVHSSEGVRARVQFGR